MSSAQVLLKVAFRS